MEQDEPRGFMRIVVMRLIFAAVLGAGLLSFIAQMAGVLLPEHITFGGYGIITDTFTGISSTMETRGIWLPSPDGRYILTGGPNFHITDSTGNTNRITRQGVIGTPGWSPDSRYLVFVGIYYRNPDIYLFDPVLNESKELVVHSGDDTLPVWSPSGTKIYFTTTRNGGEEIFEVTIETTIVSQITDITLGEHTPRISPDGTRILYIATFNCNTEIFVLNLADNSRNSLTNHPARDFDPAWDGDGQTIMFSSCREDEFGRYSMNLDGSNVVSISSLPPPTMECDDWDGG